MTDEANAIPAEAIEVAAKAIYRSWWDESEPDESAWWENLADDDSDRLAAVRYVTAAAPLLRAPLAAEVERLTGVVDEQRRVIEETADLVLRPVADMWTGRDAFMPVKVIEGARRLLTALDAADSRPSQQSGGEG